MKSMTYEQAWAYPPKHGGWAQVDINGPSIQAAVAEVLGQQLCIRAEAVYDWAMEQNVSLRDNAKLFINTPDLLLCCVLNDWSVEYTLEKLK